MINKSDIFSIGENAGACTWSVRRRPERERWGTTPRQARDLLQRTGEVSSPREIDRMEFPLSVQKQAFVRCSRYGVLHYEGCGIEINPRAVIIAEYVIPSGPRRTDAGLAEDRHQPRQAGIEAEALAVAANEVVPEGAALTKGEAGGVPEGVGRVTQVRLLFK